MREQIYTTRSIRYLARYFEENFVDRSIEDDQNLNALVYAMEASDTINESIEDNRVQIKQYEYLTGQETYEDFKRVFDEQDWIDLVITLFEAR